MRAMRLKHPAPIDSGPLQQQETLDPSPARGEVRVKVKCCGLCRTDLHVVEGDLPEVTPHIIPGHQVVGIIDQLGPGAKQFKIGDRIGIAWLRHTCGECRYCKAGSENLCPYARFTGYHENGGYAQFATVPENYAYALPPKLDDLAVAPLLCAGIIGFRALKRANVKPGCRVGMYGFGSSASLAIQVARHWNCTVYAISRDKKHQQLAMDLGAKWAGGSHQAPPEKLDSAVLFAPVGDLVPVAMEALDQGGTLSIAGIHLSDIPPLNYEKHLFHEKTICSVTANTRQDGEEFLKICAEMNIRPRTTLFPLAEANRGLAQMKHDGISGSGVLTID